MPKMLMICFEDIILSPPSFRKETHNSKVPKFNVQKNHQKIWTCKIETPISVLGWPKKAWQELKTHQNITKHLWRITISEVKIKGTILANNPTESDMLRTRMSLLMAWNHLNKPFNPITGSVVYRLRFNCPISGHKNPDFVNWLVGAVRPFRGGVVWKPKPSEKSFVPWSKVAFYWGWPSHL